MDLKEVRKLNLEKYEQLNIIGTGSFGKVVLCKQKETGKYYALKILKKYEILKLKQVDHIVSEIKILSLVNHPFLIKLEGIAQCSKYVYIMLNFVQGGELFTYLRSVGNFENPDAV